MFSERDPAFATRESQSTRARRERFVSLTVKGVFLKRLDIKFEP